MRSYALLFVAALTADLAATQVQGATTTLNFSDVCDVGVLASQRGLSNVWSYIETKKQGSCAHIIGEGTLGQANLNGIDSQWISIAMYNPGAPGEQDMLVVQYPFVNGNAYLLYDTINGKKVSLAMQGTYTIGTGADPSAPTRPDFWHAPH